MPTLSPDASEVSPALTLFSMVVRHMAHWAMLSLTIRMDSSRITPVLRIMFFILCLFNVVKQYSSLCYQPINLFFFGSVVVTSHLLRLVY